MKFLMKVITPNDSFNTKVKDGTAGKIMHEILNELKPDAVYLTEFNGVRTILLAVNLNSNSEMPKYGEPFFLKFNAQVEFHPYMTPHDLVEGGIEALGKKWG